MLRGAEKSAWREEAIWGSLLAAEPEVNGASRFQSNPRMQLALRPIGRLPLLGSDCEFRGHGGHELIAFVRSCAARSSRRS